MSEAVASKCSYTYIIWSSKLFEIRWLFILLFPTFRLLNSKFGKNCFKIILNIFIQIFFTGRSAYLNLTMPFTRNFLELFSHSSCYFTRLHLYKDILFTYKQRHVNKSILTRNFSKYTSQQI